MPPMVEFGGIAYDQLLTRELCEQLIGELFADKEDIRSVRLDPLPDGHAGYSGVRLLVARPKRADGVSENPLLVRIGPRDAIEAEKRRYNAYVRSLTGPGKVAQQASEHAGLLAAIMYDYVRGTQNQPPYSLRDVLANEEFPGGHADREYRSFSLDRACKAVTTLFRDTLGQVSEPNGWFADGRTYDEQRALWFYNTVLPPTITLRDARLVSQPDADIALTSCLASADSPIGRQLHGSAVYLQASTDYPHLRVVEWAKHADQCTLRLYLYEYRSTPDEIYPIEDIPWGPQKHSYRRIRPLAARIDVTGSTADLGSLVTSCEDGHLILDDRQIILQGQIESTRYAVLDDIRRQHFAELLAKSEHGGIVFGGIIYDNPLRSYYSLLSALRPLTTSIVHGDLNMGNILLNRLANDETVAWLIDFDKTTNGGHAVFDAVKLETEFKIHVLPHWLGSIDELLQLDQSLLQGLVNPTVELDFGKNEYLRSAYQFIATIRRAALQHLKTPIAPEEYYLGLIAYGLAALKYPNLYAKSRGRWLPTPVKIKPLAIAAYVSASFAAWAIRQLDGVTITNQSWPDPPRPGMRLLVRPRLIGRDEILARALRQLHSDEPVVLLHGPVGSGRGTIARYIGADLQRRGRALWQDQIVQPRTVEEFIALIEYRSQRERYEAHSPSALPRAINRDEDLSQKLRQIRDALEENPQPVVLLIRLTVADPELRSFVVRLANQMSRTAMVLVADGPLDELRLGLIIAVPPLDEAGVTEYVRQRDLPLDRAAVQALRTASQGLPWLIDLVIEEARKSTDLDASLSEAIVEVAPTFDVERQLGQRLRELSESIRRLLALDGLLLEHAPELLDNMASMEHEQLQIAVREAYRLSDPLALESTGWRSAPVDDTALSEYRQYIVHEYPTLWRKLAVRAFQQLASADRRRLCETAASFYAGATLRDEIYRAATFQALAQKWVELSKSLLQLADMPDLVFSGHCRTISGWAAQLLSRVRPSDGRELRELVGDCAAYLGDYDRAIEYYNQALGLLSDPDPAYCRLLARLLPVYDALGDKASMKETCGVLLQATETTDPFHRLAIAYMGSLNLFADPEQAVEVLTRAIAGVGNPSPMWGREEKALWVRLNDALALAETYRGHAKEAAALLTGIRPYAKDTPALLARIINNQAIIHYYLGDDPQDMQRARQLFKSALDIREDIRDQIGVMRTAQNLANMCSDLATDVDDWNKSEEYFDKAKAAAREVQVIERYRINANHMDLLIHRGLFERAEKEFAEAWEVFQTDQARERDQATHILLLLNRAKLALWADQRDDCRRYLQEALSHIADVDQPIDKIEWAQIALECQFRLGEGLGLTAFDWLSADYELEPDQREAAELAVALGLLSIARSDYRGAQDHFKASNQIWSKLTYHFRAAVSYYWQVECAALAKDWAGARELFALAEQALVLFGETPVLQRLRRLGEQL